MEATEKYKFTEDMSEISGLGGTYEAACRAMLKSGLDWWDTFSDANPKYHRFKGIYGICIEDNNDARDLDRAIQMGAGSVDLNGEMMGEIHQAVVGSILYIRKHGWEKYKEQMRK